MPMVDESATFSAVNNLMKEGLPRVGVSKELKLPIAKMGLVP